MKQEECAGAALCWDCSAVLSAVLKVRPHLSTAMSKYMQLQECVRMHCMPHMDT